MPILQKTGQITHLVGGWRALELFTDRYELIKLFSTYINEPNSRESILSIVGEGGNGKSLLLKYLREYYCKYFSEENWHNLKRKSTEEFVSEIKRAETQENVAVSFLDFGMPPREDERPQEAFAALLMLRRDLAKFKLHFPTFDFACVWYLYKSNKLSKDRIKNLFPNEELDFLSSIVDAISGTSWGAIGKSILNIFDKRLGERFAIYKKKRAIDEKSLKEIQIMDHDSELMDHLPALFARDLNVSMSLPGHPRRAVLFFDTHESFWGLGREGGNAAFFQRDEWFRHLIGEMDFSSGIIVVVAGRGKVRWNEASKYRIPTQFVDQHRVDNFSDNDALNYLSRGGLLDKDLSTVLVDYARVAPDQIHPLFLGLCLEVFIAAYQTGVKLTRENFSRVAGNLSKESVLIDTFLKYVDHRIEYAIRALSACRSFDPDIYMELSKKLNFPASEPDFELLTRLSFVWQIEGQGGKKFRIHDLLRRLFYERSDEINRRAHAILEQYYTDGSNGRNHELDAAEAIYHANRLDWKRGIRIWLERFSEALRGIDLDVSKALFELRKDLIVLDDYEAACILLKEGTHLRQISRAADAMAKYKEASALFELVIEKDPTAVDALGQRGEVLCWLGVLYRDYLQFEKASRAYDEALELCDRSIDLEPTKTAYNAKGLVLKGLAGISIHASRFEEAIEYYNRSIGIFEYAINQFPEFVNFYNNMGTVLSDLGLLQVDLTRYDEALTNYRKAAEYFDLASGLGHTILPTRNKGTAFLRMGRLQNSLSLYEEAADSFKKAIVGFENVSSEEPNYFAAYDDRASALESYADALTNILQHEDALEPYRQALSILDGLTEQVPQSSAYPSHQGNINRKIGTLYAALGQYENAMAFYSRAIASYDEAFKKKGPGSNFAITNKAVVYEHIGSMETKLNKNEDAIKMYLKAIDLCNQALDHTKDNNAYRVSAISYRRLGDVRLKSSDFEQAAADYKKSIKLSARLIRRSPNDLQSHNSKAVVLRLLAELQIKLLQPRSALVNFRKSIVTFDYLLSLAPNHRMFIANKIGCTRSYATFLVQRDKYEEAIGLHEEAVALHKAVIEHYPKYVEGYKGAGESYHFLGNLHYRFAQYGKANESFKRSMKYLDLGIELQPKYLHTYGAKAYAIERLAAIQTIRSNYQQASVYLREAEQLCDQILVKEPRYTYARLTKTNVLQHIAGNLVTLSNYEEAEKAYRALLVFAGDGSGDFSAWLLGNKSRALTNLGSLLTKLSRYEEAGKLHENAIRVAEAALKEKYNYSWGFTVRGDALNNLGELHADLLRFDLAIEYYKKAIVIYDEDLKLSANVNNSKGIALRRLGVAYTRLSEFEEAGKCFLRAADFYEGLIKSSAGNVHLLNNYGYLLVSFGSLKFELGNIEESMKLYRKAIREINKSLRHAPRYPAALTSKSEALWRLAESQAKLGKYKDAGKNFVHAIQLAGDVLAISPNRIETIRCKGTAALKFAELKFLTSETAEARALLKTSQREIERLLQIAPNNLNYITEKEKVDDLLKR